MQKSHSRSPEVGITIAANATGARPSRPCLQPSQRSKQSGTGILPVTSTQKSHSRSPGIGITIAANATDARPSLPSHILPISTQRQPPTLTPRPPLPAQRAPRTQPRDEATRRPWAHTIINPCAPTGRENTDHRSGPPIPSLRSPHQCPKTTGNPHHPVWSGYYGPHSIISIEIQALARLHNPPERPGCKWILHQIS